MLRKEGGLLTLIFLISACTGIKHSYSPLDSDRVLATSTRTDTKPQIIQLGLNVVADTIGAQSQFTLIGKVIVDGLSFHSESHIDKNTYLLVSQYESDGVLQSSKTVSHPLYVSAEYLTDELRFERTFVMKKMGTMVIRLPYQEGLRYIQITEFVNGKVLGISTVRL